MEAAHESRMVSLRCVSQYLLILLLTCNCNHGKPLNTFAGTYIAFTHSFATCPSDGTFAMNLRCSHFNPAKPYEKQTLTGNYTLKEDLTDSMWARVTFAVWSNNEWKQNAFIINYPRRACTMVRELAPDLFRIMAPSQPQEKAAPCVIPAGMTIWKNEPIAWEFPKMKVMPYARYLLHVEMGSNTSRTIKVCAEADSALMPRP
ncbi:uncharacterized protein LOC117649640 [Thrips palmi]|uniref:Uncharacterized protein LOC117649640 n=1 Tax=Thrips palmi TaxID=161013 RepID=A0A6P8ZT73_THRPL|nr:uncharacterized protein LOC117649640 [Thrips palmi]